MITLIKMWMRSRRLRRQGSVLMQTNPMHTEVMMLRFLKYVELACNGERFSVTARWRPEYKAVWVRAFNLEVPLLGNTCPFDAILALRDFAAYFGVAMTPLVEGPGAPRVVNGSNMDYVWPGVE